MEDSGPESDVDYDGLVQEVSDRKISNFPRDHSCDILEKNIPAFCSLKNLPKPQIKTFGLMALEREISRQPCIECIASLLLVILM